MDEDLMVFVILVTLISGGLFLIFVKMILNFFKDRRRSKGASMGTSELEAMIQRAVEAGTASLHDRLDMLEQGLDEVHDLVEARPKALPEAEAALRIEDVVEPVEMDESRRSRR